MESRVLGGRCWVLLVIEQGVNKRRGDYALLHVIKGRLAKLRAILREVEDVVMDLESNAEVRSKVEKSTLVLEI